MQAKNTNNVLFCAADDACKRLRKHIAGDAELTNTQIEASKSLIKDASKISLYFFAKSVLGFDLLTKQTHKKWCDKLQVDFLKFDRLMRLKPRGTFKTTIYAEAFILWVWAIYSPMIRFFYTSANQTLLDEVSASMDNFIGLESESLYTFIWGIKRDKKAVKNTQDMVNIIGRGDGRGTSLMFRAAGGSTNGVHPHIILADDPCDVLDRTSEATRLGKQRWFDSLIPLMVPIIINGILFKKLMFIGTRWHMRDLMNYVMEKWRKNPRKNANYDIEIEGVLTDQNELRYPELINWEMIEDLKAEMSEVFFACQYLNNPLPEGIQLFSKGRLHFIRPEQYDIKQGTNYSFFDPSQGKEGSAFPAVIWVNVFNGRRVIFDAIDVKMALASIIPLIAAKNVETLTRLFVYETNGTTLLEETFYAAHKALDYNLMIEGIHETRNKVERIAAMQPELFNGSNFFRDDYDDAYPELMNQVFYYPAWGMVDFPDVIEKALSHMNKNLPGSFGGSQASAPTGTLAGGLGGRNNY